MLKFSTIIKIKFQKAIKFKKRALIEGGMSYGHDTF